MLLLDMGIESRVRKIGFRAIIAFKISTLDVILGPPLAFTGSSVSTVVVVIFTRNLLPANILPETMLTTSHYLLFLVSHLLMALSLVVLSWHVLPKIGLHTEQLLLIRRECLILGGGTRSCTRILHLIHQIHHVAWHLGLTHSYVLHILLLEHPLLREGIGLLLIVLMLVIVLHESLYN